MAALCVYNPKYLLLYLKLCLHKGETCRSPQSENFHHTSVQTKNVILLFKCKGSFYFCFSGGLSENGVDLYLTYTRLYYSVDHFNAVLAPTDHSFSSNDHEAANLWKVSIPAAHSLQRIAVIPFNYGTFIVCGGRWRSGWHGQLT